MSEAQKLALELEEAARKLDLAPSTVGERAGQGGRFYAGLLKGKRVWPETAERVRARLNDMLSSVSCEKSHGPEGLSLQPDGSKKASDRGGAHADRVTG